MEEMKIIFFLLQWRKNGIKEHVKCSNSQKYLVVKRLHSYLRMRQKEKRQDRN